MTIDQITFIRANEMHFDLVLNHGQHFQKSHDITSKIDLIHEDITGTKMDNCTGCITEGYQKVWNAYQLNQDKNEQDEQTKASKNLNDIGT